MSEVSGIMLCLHERKKTFILHIYICTDKYLLSTRIKYQCGALQFQISRHMKYETNIIDSFFLHVGNEGGNIDRVVFNVFLKLFLIKLFQFAKSTI